MVWQTSTLTTILQDRLERAASRVSAASMSNHIVPTLCPAECQPPLASPIAGDNLYACLGETEHSPLGEPQPAEDRNPLADINNQIQATPNQQVSEPRTRKRSREEHIIEMKTSQVSAPTSCPDHAQTLTGVGDGQTSCCGHCGCKDEIRALKEHIELLNQQLEARIETYVQAHVNEMENTYKKELKAIVAAENPAKKSKKTGQLPRCCFVCGGTDSPVLNRQLGVVLDDRCRKQLNVLTNGGKLTERQCLWENAIVHLRTSTALSIMKHLGLKPAPLAHRVEPCSSQFAGESCAVCMEQLWAGCRIQTLKCGSQHRFHHECARRWLQESSTCPLCRDPLPEPQRLSIPAGDLAHLAQCTEVTPALPCAQTEQIVNPAMLTVVNIDTTALMPPPISRCQAMMDDAVVSRPWADTTASTQLCTLSNAPSLDEQGVSAERTEPMVGDWDIFDLEEIQDPTSWGLS